MEMQTNCFYSSLYIFSILIISVIIPTITSAQTVGAFDTCRSQDATNVTRCLEPLVTLWSQYGFANVILNNVGFPLYVYSEAELRGLCTLYLRARVSCLPNELIGTCRNHPSVQHSQTILDYGCTHKTFIDHHSCIQTQLQQNLGCLEIIKRQRPFSLSPRRRCRFLPAFYMCLRDKVDMNCGPESHKVFRESIHAFGCTTSTRPPPPPLHDATQFDECDGNDIDSIGNCIRPLIESWLSIRSTSAITEIRFPVFSADMADLFELCEIYTETQRSCIPEQVETRCVSNFLIRFTRSLLSYPCNHSTRRVFFEHYPCISKIVHSRHSQCGGFIVGTYLPGRDLEKCSNMTEYYRCMRYWIDASCDVSGLRIFQETILSFGCNVDYQVEDSACDRLDHRHVSTCLKPIMDIWIDLRNNHSEANDVVFPLFKYRKQDLILLCNQYSAAKAQCLPESLIQSCQENPTVKFFDSLLGYACKPSTISEFFDAHSCISRVVQRNPRCLELIRGTSLPGNDTNNCDHMEEFHGCLAEQLTESCGSSSLIVFEKAIQNFGCQLGVCKAEDKMNITNCLQPLMRTWSSIRGEKPSLNDITFPLFKYSERNMLVLCENYLQTRIHCLSGKLIRKCGNNPLVSFTLNHLAYPCERPTSQRLFDNFKCISQVVLENQHCSVTIQNISSPENDNQKCTNVTGYYNCIATPLAAKCSGVARDVFTESLLHFGCKLDLPFQEVSAVITPTGSVSDQRNQQKTFVHAVCFPADQGVLRECLDPLIAKWTHLQRVSPDLINVAFPLYLYRMPDLRLLCQTYLTAKRSCLTAELALKCPSDGWLGYLEALLGYSCSQPTSTKFFRNFQCISDMMQRNEQCINLLNSIATPSQSRPSRSCGRMPDFYNCSSNMIRSRCGIDGLTTLEASITFYGCSRSLGASLEITPAFDPELKLSIQEETADDLFHLSFDSGSPDSDIQVLFTKTNTTKRPTSTSEALPEIERTTELTSTATSTRTTAKPTTSQSVFATWTIGTSNTLIPIELPRSIVESTVARPIKELKLTSAIAENSTPRGSTFSFCSVEMARRLQTCLHPVESSLRPILQGTLRNFTFPLYQLTRIQVLTLCDQYASAFLTCEIQLFLNCRSLPSLRLVDSLLGYACGHAEAFFRAHRCVGSRLSQKEYCLDPLNKTRERRNTSESPCNGVAGFYNCLKGDLPTCSQKDVDTFTNTIHYFGCDL